MKTSLLIAFFLSYGIATAQNFTNPSVENWGYTAICEVNVPPDNWSDYSLGIGEGVDEANFSLCPTTIPANASNGLVYARAIAISGTTGEGMFQNVPGFIPGSVYHVFFDYAGSNLYTGTNDVQWHLFIDDMDVDQTPVFSSTDSLWETHSFGFTATAATHKIGFRACTAAAGGAGSAGIDNFILTSTVGIEDHNSDLAASLFPNPFSFSTTLQTNKTFKDASLIVYNLSGQPVKQVNHISGQTVNLHRGNLPNGLYYIRLIQDNSVVLRKKLIIN